MPTSNIVWLVVAVAVAVLLLAIVIIVSRRASHRRRHLKAEGIREEARVETDRVERREALAGETAAKARAAQAEAEAKAAEAARLQDRAAAHQSEAATSREELDAQWKHADSIDPKAKANADRVTDGHADESYDRAADPEAATPTTDAPSDTNRGG